MAAVAPAFEECGVRIAEDPVKGKVVFAERDIKAGEVIFSEQSFVSATWSTNVCDGCEEEKSESNPQCFCERTGEPKQMYSKVLSAHAEHRNKIVEMMAKHLDSVAEVDRARCVLKCLGMYERDPKALDVVLSLTKANYEHCLADAQQLRFQVPEIFPKDFTDEQMATIISVLNCNSHELENLGGSGLFLSACRMEHSCVPNCSFTTYDSTLWMTAIRPIAKGEALSIDYGNFFYRPTIERMESLYESYGFVCTCDGCVKQPDKCRSFKCSSASCTDGVVWPYPVTPTGPIEEPDELEFDWKCSKCGYVPTEDELDMFDIAEQQLLEEGFPESLEEIEELLKTTPLHERHYLLFWALDSFGCEGAALIALIDEAEQRVNLAEVWKRIIAYMNELFPQPLHEKTIYYDNLAQVEVVLGNRNAAMEAYAKAYEISCIVSGVDCTPTKKLKELSENPPANAAELRELYGAVKRRPEAEEDWEDEEEVEDDEEEEEEE